MTRRCPLKCMGPWAADGASQRTGAVRGGRRSKMWQHTKWPVACLMSILMIETAFAESCATAQGSWSSGIGGGWVVNQNQNNGISGIFTTGGGGACPGGQLYGLTGSYTGNGSFQILATWGIGVRPPGCAETINYSGTLLKPGCHKATVTWTNSGGASGVLDWSHSCTLPEGETTPQHVGWVGLLGFTTVAQFRQSLIRPVVGEPDYNFGGRQLAETFLIDGEDTCWFDGSDQPERLRGNSKVIDLTSGRPTYYRDEIGMSSEIINYYRRVGRTSCYFRFPQTVSLDCAAPQGFVAYHEVDLMLAAGKIEIISARGDTQASKVWGLPAPEILVPSITLPLLQ